MRSRAAASNQMLSVFFDKPLARSPITQSYGNISGRLYVSESRLNEAATEFLEALRLNPQNAEILGGG